MIRPLHSHSGVALLWLFLFSQKANEKSHEGVKKNGDPKSDGSRY